MDPYETKISDVLASQAFLSKHPGSSQLGSDIYSSAANSTSEIIQRQRYSGQYVSNANQLGFGAQSSFFLTPGSVMNGLMLSCSVIVPQFTRAPDFWFLHAIDSVELIISGSSSVQSLKINGRSHIDMVMATLNSKKLSLLRQTNGHIDHQAVGALTVNASLPLHLFFSSAEIKSLFPLDTSTLQSQIIVNIRWKQNYNIFTGDSANAVTLPSTFNTLYMRVADQVSISNNFAISNQLRSDPSLIYSIPGTYLQSFSQVVNVSDLTSESMVNLTSMPSGNLSAILVSMRETQYEGSPITQALIQPYAPFGTVRVLYNGIELYRVDSPQEMLLTNAICTDKDNGVNVKWVASVSNTVGVAPVLYETSPVLIIPMANEISQVLRDRRSENTKDYSGSSIQFHFTPAAGLPYSTDATLVSSNTSFAQSTGDYRLNFTFINNALYEISQRSVSLEM